MLVTGILGDNADRLCGYKESRTGSKMLPSSLAGTENKHGVQMNFSVCKLDRWGPEFSFVFLCKSAKPALDSKVLISYGPHKPAHYQGDISAVYFWTLPSVSSNFQNSCSQ